MLVLGRPGPCRPGLMQSQSLPKYSLLHQKRTWELIPQLGLNHSHSTADERLHLNAGLGLDWAGHVIARDCWLLPEICSIATEENFGILLPIGSGKV